MNARLFPVFNPNDEVGIQDLLWLQGSYQNPLFLPKLVRPFIFSHTNLFMLSLDTFLFIRKPTDRFVICCFNCLQVEKLLAVIISRNGGFI